MRSDFAEIKEKSAENKRVAHMTRSEARKFKDQNLDDIIRLQEEEEKKNSSNDPGFDLFEAVNILSKFDAAWCEKVAGAAKW